MTSPIRASSALAFGLLVALFAACAEAPTARFPTATASATASLKPPLPSACAELTPIQSSQLGPEVQGIGQGATLWALLMPTGPLPVAAEEQIKIVWRMTGSGDFTLIAVGPGGVAVRPTQGPQPHLGSNWNRPGDEWGTIFVFPTAGCWDLHAARGTASGDVYLPVAHA